MLVRCLVASTSFATRQGNSWTTPGRLQGCSSMSLPQRPLTHRQAEMGKSRPGCRQINGPVYGGLLVRKACLCFIFLVLSTMGPILFDWVKRGNSGSFPFSVPALVFNAWAIDAFVGFCWAVTQGSKSFQLLWRPDMVWRFFITTSLFVAGDMLSFMSIEHLDVGTFSLVGKALAIILTVLLSRLVLKKGQSLQQYSLVAAVAVATMFFCQSEVQARQAANLAKVLRSPTQASMSWYLGLAERSTAVFLTSLAAVLQEQLLTNRPGIPFMVQQSWMSLAAMTLSLLTLRFVHGLPLSALTEGFGHWRVLVLLFSYVASGLTTALMVKKLGAIAKSLCVPIYLGFCYAYAVYTGSASLTLQVLAAWTASTACILLYAISKIKAQAPGSQPRKATTRTRSVALETTDPAPESTSLERQSSEDPANTCETAFGRGIALPLTPSSAETINETDSSADASESKRIGPYKVEELALRAEFLKQELKQLEATDAEEATKKRIDTSAQLLRTYDAVRQNLQTSQAQRDEVRHLREQELLALQQQIQARMVGLQSFADSCTSQQRDLEGELNQSQDSIKLQLQHMDEVRAGIDKEIDELDERKRQLRIELDTVSRQLDEARMKQKQHMESCDRQRAEFYNTKAALKEKLDAANTDGAAKAKEKELLDQTRQLIEETGLALQRTVREQTEELKQKQAEFQSHFKLLLLDHLRYAEGRAKDLQAEAQKAVASQDPGAKEAARAAAQGAADALDELCKDIDFVGDSGVKAQLENLRVAHGATLALLGAPASAASAPATAAATLSPPAEAAYPSESAAHSSQQLVDGESLRAFSHRQPCHKLSEQAARLYYRQVVEGVAVCHERLVAHRDLKLENVLLDKGREGVKIIDFGFAAHVPSKETKLKAFCGTPSYMAPEIIRGEGYSGFAADVWALGVVLFALLSGTLPFSAKTEMQLYARIRRGSFTFPDCLGDSQKRLLRGVLRKDASARPSASALLQHAWVAGRDDGGHLSGVATATAFLTDSGKASNRQALQPAEAPVRAHGYPKSVTNQTAHLDDLTQKICGVSNKGATAFGGS
ncbi:HSL1 [Symbiodinium sp. CCMP2592]|nr:HSL1 [Symbiodinium sp. CCMP2592]